MHPHDENPIDFCPVCDEPYYSKRETGLEYINGGVSFRRVILYEHRTYQDSGFYNSKHCEDKEKLIGEQLKACGLSQRERLLGEIEAARHRLDYFDARVNPDGTTKEKKQCN